MKKDKDNNEGKRNIDVKKLHVDKKKIKESFTNKAFRAGGYSTLVSIIVIAIAVAVVLMVDKLPSTYTKLDVSKTQLFTLSQQTKEIVKSLDQEVDVYYICQAGQEDSYVEALTDRYAAMNDNLKIIKKDPVVYPSFTSKYTTSTLADNSLIVVSGDRSTVIGYSDIFVSDYSSGSAASSFDGERQLTSAIDYVTSENLPKVYTLTGHGEKSLSSSFSSAVSKENIDVESLSLVSQQKVPEDAQCLIVIAPTSDISSDEKNMILSYLEGGGNLLLFTDYLEAGNDMPNLEELMAGYGVKKVDGVVLEGDTSYCYKASNYLLPEMDGSHAITSPLVSGNRFVLMPQAQGIAELDNHRDSISITKLLTTSDSSYSKINVSSASSYEKEPGDASGPFAVGMAITETVNNIDTNIVWYSSSYLLDDSVNEAVSGGNQDLVLNTLGYLTDKEDSISIHSKSLGFDSLVLTSAQASSMKALLIVGIPVVFLGIGAYVCIRRKHR
jgi:ABC-2 type transport system permease protein